jgi:hypothetical protein
MDRRHLATAADRGAFAVDADAVFELRARAVDLDE